MCWGSNWDCDGWDAYSETTPKARKQHRCYECRRTIEVGEVYHRVSGVYDGSADTYKFCSRCVRVRKALEDEANEGLSYSDSEYVPFGELRCCLRERNQDKRAALEK